MPEEKLQTLSLQVINGSELESGRAARCLFTQQGNVGHGPECHWSVQDRQQSIPAQAFTVILHDGTFCLRPQTAQLWLNQAKVTATSDLIQLRQGDEIQIGRLMPQLTGLLFNDHTPFISEQTKQWLAASPDAKVAPVAQIGEESKAARACFAEQGLEAALRYLDMLPEGDPRDQFHRQYLAAQLTEEAGLVQLAQQQYRMLFRMGLQMMVADWEPSLLEQLEQKFTAEQ
ncbi:TPA: hypothetical protein H7W19_004228 [Escherichia coli]|nr:hypothetical protein [Escherichia coli]STJ62084.1 ImpA domain-containing protein [Escherichia coli]HAH9087960.1 hypothetical protein [Escherichia coli]HAL9471703.1 hypothetical protein [Escherichia coli]HAL9837958.1 hypothetical protein [Escherichia coli]